MNGERPHEMLAALPPPPPLHLPKRGQRSLKLNNEEVVDSVLARLRNDLDDRTGWMNDYLRRYAKYRGWVEAKTWQWKDASNAHIAIEMYTCQRIEDALYNAVISQRPIMQSRALQKQHTVKESRIDSLLDYEVFSMADGERFIRDAIHNYVVDGTVHMMDRWVSGERSIRLFERLPAPPADVDLRTYLAAQITRLFGEQATMLPRDKPHRFVVMTPEKPINIELYEGAGGDLELIQQEELGIDHLGLSVEDIEDIVVPSDAINPQPPSESNPRGAHHVIRLCTASMNTIRVRQDNGTYDLLTEADVKTIEGWVDQTQTDDTSQPKTQKDDLEGVNSQAPAGDHETVRVLEVYDRYDVDNDGLEEDVIFWIVTNAEHTDGRLARARYLTEMIPPGPQGARRPIVKRVLFGIPNRYYGLSMPELIEGTSDLIQMFFNVGADIGVLANTPFFFYRAASGLKPEVIRLNPGEGYPLDDPRQDVYFPQLPQAQGTWIFSELTMLNQFLERLTMQGQLQFGGIPQGKASAFRTTGTTQAVLQQGDTRVERILRQFFEGLAEVWDHALSLCQRYLPPSTEYRMLGVPEAEQGFDRIVDRAELAGQFGFTWRASVLNSNPMLRQQSAMQLVQTLASPFLLQMQLVGPQELYRAVRRLIESLQEPNPDQYLKRPPGIESSPPITAEQAISMILAGHAPISVNPVEPMEEHAEKLLRFMQSDAFGLLNQQQVALFGAYLRRVNEAVHRVRMQAQMATQFQQSLGGQGGNGQGALQAPPNPVAMQQATGMSPATPAEAGMTPQGP